MPIVAVPTILTAGLTVLISPVFCLFATLAVGYLAMIYVRFLRTRHLIIGSGGPV